ncbi:ABC transporter ATP-binding protein, partial [Mycobacterium tuberculosis]|nr:ABC transporter ATP-binding protein [Mycobacterium tuberculosis]
FLWNGAETAFQNPAAARAKGVGMVFQHFSLFDALTVTENVALALDDARDMRVLAERIRTVSQSYGLPLEPGARVVD